MGFFSFKTADTQESIANRYTPHVKTVYLLQPNQPPIREEYYDGYGRFGGVDCFVWLARQNYRARDLKGLTDDQVRDKGLELYFSGKADTPLKFSFNSQADYMALPASESCPEQGYFFDGVGV